MSTALIPFDRAHEQVEKMVDRDVALARAEDPNDAAALSPVPDFDPPAQA